MITMPRNMVDSTALAMSLSEVFAISDITMKDYPWASRMIGRFPIPYFQRELCWTLEEEQAFIESIYKGFDIGSYMVNRYRHVKHADGSTTYVEFSDCLIDGQQRINTICRYFNNEFKVCGAYFKDVCKQDQIRFKRHQFTRKEINVFDEATLVEIYNTLNFSGKRHTEADKAVVRTKDSNQ